MWMVFFNVKVNFDNLISVNIVNSVIYKFFSLQELILLTTKNFFVFFGLIYYGLHVCCEGCTNSLRKLKKWEEAEFSIHKCSRLSELCDCPKPFR